MASQSENHCDEKFTRQVISQDFFPAFSICFTNRPLYKNVHERREVGPSHQGKKELACIVCKPLVSCLWGCGEAVNPQKFNIQKVQGGFVLQTKGRPRPAYHFSGFCLLLSNHTPGSRHMQSSNPFLFSHKNECKHF